MLTLMIVVGTVRPGRIGPAIAEWVRHEAELHGEFEVDVVDLAQLNLPFVDEPSRGEGYRFEHSKAWSERVAAADAVVFVSPEYHHGVSPVLKNAIDFLSEEWARKPVGLVAYAGSTGGAGATMGLTPTLFALGMIGAPTRLQLSFVNRQVLAGVFYAEADQIVAMSEQLGQLHALAALLPRDRRALRTEARFKGERAPG